MAAGHQVSTLATLWPAPGGRATSFTQWVQQLLPHTGRETSSRVQAALRRKQYFPAATATLSRDEERGVSKTEASAQEGVSKESALSSRQDAESLRAALSTLAGQVPTQSVDVLKPLYLKTTQK